MSSADLSNMGRGSTSPLGPDAERAAKFARLLAEARDAADLDPRVPGSTLWHREHGLPLTAEEARAASTRRAELGRAEALRAVRPGA